MDWLTLDDLITAFGEAELRQLTDRRRTGQIDEDVIAPALVRAKSEAEALLRGNVPQFPTPTIPPAVKGAAADIARFYLFEKGIPEAVQTRYNAARAYLKSASFRLEELGLVAETPEQTSGGSVAAAPRQMRLAQGLSKAYEFRIIPPSPVDTA